MDSMRAHMSRSRDGDDGHEAKRGWWDAKKRSTGRLGLRTAQDDHHEGTGSSSRAHVAIDRDLPYWEVTFLIKTGKKARAGRV